MGLGAITAIEHSVGKALAAGCGRSVPRSILPSRRAVGARIRARGRRSWVAAQARAAALPRGGDSPVPSNGWPPRRVPLRRLRRNPLRKQLARKVLVLGQAISDRSSRTSSNTPITTTPKSTSSRALLLLAAPKKPRGENTGMVAQLVGETELPGSTRFPQYLGSPKPGCYLRARECSRGWHSPICRPRALCHSPGPLPTA